LNLVIRKETGMKRTLLLTGLILLTACSVVRPPEPTATPIPPTETSVPPTPTAIPSDTAVPPTEVPSDTPVPTDTLVPSETPIPTETTIPEPTVPPTPDPHEGQGDLLFSDPFDVAANWGIANDDESEMVVADGVMTMTLDAPNIYRLAPTGKVITKNRTVADFYGQVTITPTECRPLSEYGMVFRGTGTQEEGFDQWYAFVVRCEGTWAVYRFMNDEFFVTAGSLTPADAINKGANATNQLGIRVAGDEFRLYVNGIYLATDSDAAIPEEGRFGVYGATFDAEKAVYTFDDFSVWHVSP
jgi:hypothetical protein